MKPILARDLGPMHLGLMALVPEAVQPFQIQAVTYQAATREWSTRDNPHPEVDLSLGFKVVVLFSGVQPITLDPDTQILVEAGK